jgi:predicted Zn-dependent protease
VNHTARLLICLIAVVLGWVVYLEIQPANASTSFAPVVAGSKIYFAPIGNFPSDQLDPLVQYYRKKYGLGITVLPSIPVDPSTRDVLRHQLMAENLVVSLRSDTPRYAYDSKAILIGFTSEDIYPTSKDWQFAFGWRRGETRTAVVSTARLNLPGDAGRSNLATARMRKIVTKDIGVLYYGLPLSQNPRSVLYSQIMGIEELDRVGEDF